MPINRIQKKPEGKLALIDGDVVAYSCGFASDTWTYTCPDGKEFRYKKDAKEHCINEALLADDIVKTVEAEPVEHCLHSVKRMLTSIVAESGSVDCKVYLTGHNNFRKEIPYEYIYKGNRTSDKPTHFEAIIQYLKNSWKAEVQDTQEADDAMGIYQCNNNDTVICTVDKDLDMIPGLHYNWNKPEKGVYEVTEEDGIRFFYEQLLKGDAVDNIIAIHGMGNVRAKEKLSKLDNEEDYAQETQILYAEDGLTPEQYLTNARLLWIRRKEGELWTPPMNKITKWLSSYMKTLEK